MSAEVPHTVSPGGIAPGTAEALLAALGDALDFSTIERSFSPCFSNIGLGFAATEHAPEAGGLRALHIHYNRRTTTLGAPFLALPGQVQSSSRTPLCVRQRFAWGEALFAFSGRDSVVIEVHGLPELRLGLHDAQLSERRCAAEDGVLSCAAYAPTSDPRDPDARYPLLFLAAARCGQASFSESGELVVRAAGVRIVLALHVAVLDVERATAWAALAVMPDSAAAAEAMSLCWWRDFVGPFTLRSSVPRERAVIARAVYALAMNATSAPGLLSGRVAVFPNRGTYATHYLWDTCFQNLGLELLAPQLAVDSLRLLTDNLRCDGKMAHFLCSTWMRPHESQPPLVGWAALRLIRARGDDATARALVPPLLRNCRWWLAQRMTRAGLIASPHPLETGWDDTPRFDHGPVIALDMNSHLILQLRCTAALATRIGDQSAATWCQATAQQLSQRLIELCLDPEDGLFHDCLQADLRRLPIRTPAAFLPIAAGVLDHDPDAARTMLRRHLLDPARFNGAAPIPSVAYDEPTFVPRKPGPQTTPGRDHACWRGPVWLPVAWLCLDALAHVGLHAERRDLMARFYRMIIADGDLREFFDAHTGQGLGAHQQGWTAGIALRLHAELST